jgi:hypothetical protein
VQAEEVSIGARVSAAKSETRRREGEEGGRRLRRGRKEVSKRDAGSIEFNASAST